MFLQKEMKHLLYSICICQIFPLIIPARIDYKIYPDNTKAIFKAPILCKDFRSITFCRRFKDHGIGKFFTFLYLKKLLILKLYIKKV
uniref:Uncharacterized protein n=1 Tax=Panagrolaimus sp. PS1159 TaxID=55785 RepID=A0AC35FVE9_9BILA